MMIWKAKTPIVSRGSAMVPQRKAFVRTRVTYSRLMMSQILRMAVRDLFNEDVVQGRLDQLEAGNSHAALDRRL